MPFALHPVESSNDSQNSASSQITIVAFVTTWCPDCSRTLRTLTRNSIPYEAIDIEAGPGAEETMKSLNGGSGKVPTLIIESQEGRTVLIEPSDRALLKVVKG